MNGGYNCHSGINPHELQLHERQRERVHELPRQRWPAGVLGIQWQRLWARSGCVKKSTSRLTATTSAWAATSTTATCACTFSAPGSIRMNYNFTNGSGVAYANGHGFAHQRGYLGIRWQRLGGGGVLERRGTNEKRGAAARGVGRHSRSGSELGGAGGRGPGKASARVAGEDGRKTRARMGVRVFLALIVATAGRF